MTTTSANRAKPLPPNCAVSHTSASAVSAMGSAIARRKRSIHAPGLGSMRRSAGTKPMSRNGKASPSPRAANNNSASGAGSSNAAPSAAAMKGPVQGVAATAASSPVAKAPRTPERPCPLPVSMLGSSKIPAKLSVMTVASTSSAMTTEGSCNWNAQPTCSPPARKASMIAPSAAQASTTPAV